MLVSKRTIILSGLGAASIAGLAYFSFRIDPVPVDLAHVVKGPLEVTINADGQTRVRNLYEVAAPIAGTAMRSPVEVGDRVVAGETLIATVQPVSSGLLDARSRLQAEAALQEAEAARHVAEADRKQAEETRDFTQSQYDRTKVLVTRGVASITRLEDVTQQLRVADSALIASEARLSMADGAVERARALFLDPGETEIELTSCCIEIRAPADGVILSIAAISQRPVVVGAPLVSIGDPADLEIVVDILSNDAVRLQQGAHAYVERWGGDGALEARLDRIDPRARTKVSALGIEEQRVDAYFSLVTQPKNRTRLSDGFSVFLRIVEWRAEDVLQIPLSAIFRNGEEWAVFVSSDGIAERRSISVGQRNGQMTEVTSGLDAGEHVVMHPSDDISDGTAMIERSEL